MIRTTPQRICLRTIATIPATTKMTARIQSKNATVGLSRVLIRFADGASCAPANHPCS